MVEPLLLVVYGALALTVIAGRGTIAVLSLILYLVVYDYVFLHLEAAFGRSLVAAKTFSEVLLVASLLAVFVLQARRRVWRRLDFVVVGTLGLVTISGLGFARSDVVLALEDYRVLLAPLVLASLLSLSVRFGPRDARILRRLLLGVGIGAIAIASYQFLTFDGDLRSVWRHDFLLALKLEQDPTYPTRLLQYSIVRNGELRASSVFISAIDFSLFAASIGVLAFATFVVKRHWALFAVVPVSIVGAAVSQVRIGFIALAFGIALTLIFGSRSLVVRRTALLSPFAAIAVIFGYVVFGGGLNDPSTLGRLPQYVFLLQEFTLTGSGFGSYRGQFDSYLIYAGLTLGAGAVLLALAIGWMGVRLERVDRLLAATGGDVEHRVLARFALVQLLTAIVIFSVHHTVGSVTYFLVFLLAMMASRFPMGDRSPRAVEAVAAYATDARTRSR